MKNVSIVLLIISLLCLIYQDFRYRQIHIFFLALTFVALIFESVSVNGITQAIYLSMINLLFVLFQIVFIFLYIRFAKKDKFIVDKYIGLGDLLLFVAVIPAFSIYNYLFFFIASLCISIATVPLWKCVQRQFTGLIPLAGICSAVLMVVVLAKIFLPIDLYGNYLFHRPLS